MTLQVTLRLNSKCPINSSCVTGLGSGPVNSLSQRGQVVKTCFNSSLLSKMPAAPMSQSRNSRPVMDLDPFCLNSVAGSTSLAQVWGRVVACESAGAAALERPAAPVSIGS